MLGPFVDDPLAFLERMHREHGDVVRLRFFPEMYHLVSDPDEVRRILVTDAHRYHAVPADLAREAAGPEPDVGVRFHTLARAMFHGDGGVGAMVPAIVASVDATLDAWGRVAGPVELATALDELALAVLADVLLGGAELDVAPLAAAFDRAATAGSVQHNVSVYQRAAGDVIRADPAFRAAAAHVAAVVERLIDERRHRGPGPDLLSRLVFDRDTDVVGRIATDGELRSSVGVLLVASHSAPASALVWALHLLARHPAELDALTVEVDAVLGRRLPTADDLPRLKRTRAVLLEAMRLYPPVWVLAPRVAHHADVIGGFSIPARSKLLISPWLLHRHPAVWAHPERFEPDRFGSGEPRAYLPFGAGPWGCVGAQFGLVEARLALAMIVQRFTWTPVRAAEPVPEPRLALHPRDGLPAHLARR